MAFNFAPEKTGTLKIRTLHLPGVRHWSDLAAGVTFTGRNLVLNDLALGPEILLRRCNLDVSQLGSNEVSMGLEGVSFGAPLSLAAKVTDLNDMSRLHVRAESSRLRLDALSEYFNLTLPLHGTLQEFALTFDGVPENPASWTGNLAVKLDGMALEKQPLGAISATVEFGSGRAVAALSGEFDARNKVALHADLALPQKLDSFLKTSASGRLDLSASDLAALTGQQALGDLAAQVDFKLSSGVLIADIAADSAHAVAFGVEATKLNFAVHLEKNISEQRQPAFTDLVTN